MSLITFAIGAGFSESLEIRTAFFPSGKTPSRGYQSFAERVIPAAFRLPSRDQCTARTALMTRQVEMRGRER